MSTQRLLDYLGPMLLGETAFFIYIDVLGVRAELESNPQETCRKLRGWQDKVRARANLHCPGSTVVTAFDNVLARVAVDEADQVLALAEDAANQLGAFGFEKYFGVITYGSYESDPTAMIETGGQGTDIRKQHLEFLSEAWVECALAEKVSAKLGNTPHRGKSVWVSDRAAKALSDMPWSHGEKFDVRELGGSWPFEVSTFWALPFDTTP